MSTRSGDINENSELELSQIPMRFVTAASLFDGHDAAINIMRRILQSQGAEVIHLGHDRSVDEIVDAAIEEDAHAIAVSSYQGGHNEFFRYIVDQLRERGADHVRVYGGGGGTWYRTACHRNGWHWPSNARMSTFLRGRCAPRAAPYRRVERRRRRR